MPYTTPTTIQQAIDALEKTSGVNGEPLGGTIDIANQKGKSRIKFVKPLRVPAGVRVRGVGTGTVVEGDILIDCLTTNGYTANVTLQDFQLHGSIRRSNNTTGFEHLRFIDITIYGGCIDMRGAVLYQSDLINVEFREWQGSILRGNFRILLVQGLKMQQGSTTAVSTDPLIDVDGGGSKITFISCWLSANQMLLYVRGGFDNVTWIGSWNEPTIDGVPQILIDGMGSVFAGDYICAQDVQQIVCRGGATFSPGLARRATNHGGAEIDVSQAFIEAN